MSSVFFFVFVCVCVRACVFEKFLLLFSELVTGGCVIVLRIFMWFLVLRGTKYSTAFGRQDGLEWVLIVHLHCLTWPVCFACYRCLFFWHT